MSFADYLKETQKKSTGGFADFLSNSKVENTTKNVSLPDDKKTREALPGETEVRFERIEPTPIPKTFERLTIENGIVVKKTVTVGGGEIKAPTGDEERRFFNDLTVALKTPVVSPAERIPQITKDVVLNNPVIKDKLEDFAKRTSGTGIKAMIDAFGPEKTFDEAYTALRKSQAEGNDSAVSNFTTQLGDAAPQTLLGVALAFVPVAGPALSTIYWGAVSAGAQIEEKGEVTSLTNVGIDVVGDRMLGASLESLFKKPIKSLLATVTKNFTTEGGTEVAQDLLKYANDWKTAKTQKEKDKILEEAKEYFTSGQIAMTFGVGGVIGGGIGGGTYVIKETPKIIEQRKQELIKQGFTEKEATVRVKQGGFAKFKADKNKISETETKIENNIKEYQRSGGLGAGTEAPQATLRDLNTIAKTKEAKDFTAKKVNEAITNKELVLDKDGKITLYRVGEVSDKNDLVSATYDKTFAESFDRTGQAKITEFKVKPEDIKYNIGGVEKEVLVSKDILRQTTELDTLAQEARKYKSAEEFVKEQISKESGFGDYHQAPRKDNTPVEERMEDGGDFSLEEVIDGKSTAPDDFFDKNVGARYYSYDNLEGRQSETAIDNVKRALKAGKKDVKITAYRAIPDDVQLTELQNGDWVTFSKEYAEQHGIRRFNGKYKLIEQEVKPNEVWWDVNDINEWGYDNGNSEYRLSEEERRQQLTDIYNQAVKTAPEGEEFLKGVKKDIIKKIQSKLNNKAYIRSITKKEVKQMQTQVIDAIEDSNLEANDKAKFLKTIKNIQTAEQLNKALPDIQDRISNLEEASLKRTIQSQIDKELKYTKPLKKGQRMVGKYDYQSNKIFDGLREYNKFTQEKAISELNSMPTENLSEAEKIKARFLSYKANGAKSSILLQEQVLADINELKRIGAEAKDEADFIKKMERQEKVDEVLKAITEQKESIKFLKGAKSAYISSVANLYSTLNAIAGKEVADKYDYGRLQTNSQYAFDAKVEQVKEKFKEIYGIKKDNELNKIFLNDLVPTNFEITGTDGFTEKISKLDLMNIYNGLKNDLIRERYNNYFGAEQVNSLLQNLTEEDVKLADSLMKEVQGYKEVLNKRNIELFGRDLGNIENYWPSKSEFQQEFFDDIKIQGEIPSAMRERSKSSKVVPQMANSWLIFQRHIAQAEHIKNLSSKYEEIKRLFSDRRIKKTIQEKYGDNTYNALMSHIETFSLNKRTELLDVFSDLYSKGLNNWVKAKVASPTVFARQLISSVYSVEQVGIKNFLKYQSNFLRHPRASFRFMWNNIPFIRSRFKKGYSEALQDVLRGTNELNIKVNSISKYTTIASRGGDITAIMLNGYPIIKTELAKGKTMEEAIETFQKFTEKTQQSPSQANLSQLQRNRNALQKTFFRFKNTLNQLLRLQVDANIQFINGDITAKEFASKTSLYSIYTPIMYTLAGYIITQGFKGLFGKEDDEKTESLAGDILQQIIIQPFQTLPVLDAITETAYSEIRKRTTGKDYYYGDSLFSYPLLDDISRAWSKATKEEPTMDDWLSVMSLLQEPATGIPTETLSRYYKYATKGNKSKGISPAKGNGSLINFTPINSGSKAKKQINFTKIK